MLGGMWGPNSAREVVMPTKAYLEKLYKLGADDDFDSIAIHPYANNASRLGRPARDRAQGGGRRR